MSRLLKNIPAAADRVLFEMGFIYAHPQNEQKDYQKSLDCFQKVIKDYPESRYRQDSEMMILYINNITMKDKKIFTQHTQIVTQQTQIETLEREVKSKDNEIITLQKKIEALEQEVKSKVFALRNGPADKILIEKKERLLTLISKDKVLKTYKIALGETRMVRKKGKATTKPRKEPTSSIQGTRTVAITYLFIFPIRTRKTKNEPRELGVSPGGDIMIHGIKNGFSWIGDLHAER
ncbi:MAG: outer membrane protein assembly factor BamD [Desulfobacterales bacterium]|nr:outer membrane protein assembly factor BamD [Desulfobacterales bacterium]